MKRDFLLYFLTVLLAIACTLLYLARSEISTANSAISKAKESERTAWGKLYDLQEQRDDRAFAEEAAMHLKLFETEQKLAECKSITRTSTKGTNP